MGAGQTRCDCAFAAVRCSEWRIVAEGVGRFPVGCGQLPECGQAGAGDDADPEPENGSVRDLEQGRRQPALVTLIALCSALSVSCDALLAKPADRPPVTPGRPRKPAAADKPARKGKGKK
jgi:hypothetical protein